MGCLRSISADAADEYGFLVFRSSNPTKWPSGFELRPRQRIKLEAADLIEAVDSHERKLVLKGPGIEEVPPAEKFSASLSLLRSFLSLPDAVVKDVIPRGQTLLSPANPLVIDVAKGGRQCLPAGESHELWQPGSQSDVVRGRLSAVGDSTWITWDRGSSTIPWPPGIPLVSGLEYTIEVPALNVIRPFRVILVPGLSGTKGLAASNVLLANGCSMQAIRVLEALPAVSSPHN